MSTVLHLLTRLVSPGGDAEKDGNAAGSSAKRLLSQGSLQPPVTLARHCELPASLNVQAGDCDRCRTGVATLDGKELAWREFMWSSSIEIDHRRWHCVRWRFYANGIVCYDALMSNSSTGIDLGDLQGHGIELREAGGFLLGIWAAAFYVRRGRPPLGFQANIVDDHVPLKMHFAEIDEKQSGLWLSK